MGYVTGTPWTLMGYLTSFTETDPTISAWAKSLIKPTYTASEVGLGNVPNISFSGSNTGDETLATIKTKLGITNLSGSNTGDETTTSIQTKLGITTLSGSNTGDNAVNSLYSGLATSKQDTLSGTGFIKISGSTISYDNSTYVTGTPWTGMGYVTGTPWTLMGYLTSFTETDPTVSAWAKAGVKPSYAWTEIGSKPTALSQFTNDLGNYGGFLTSASMSDYVPFTGAASNLNLGTHSITTNGITTTGDIGITGSIIPSANDTYDLGSPTKMWRNLYVGAHSIYVNGQEVLQTDPSQNVVVSADLNQNLNIKTSGTGNIELNPSGTGQILLKGSLLISGGKNITTSDSLPLSVPFGITTLTNISATGTILGSNISGSTSGTNTGDNAVNSLYSGLATSKQDTLVSGSSIKTINGNSVLGSGDLSVGSYTLPIASAITLGGVKVGTGLSIDSGTGALSASGTGTGDVNWNGNTNGSKKTLGSIDNQDIGLITNNTERITVLNGGNVGIGNTAPSAVLNLKAGTATVGTAPLKFTTGTNLTTAEAGAMEWNGTNLFMTQTSGPTRQQIAYLSDVTSISGNYLYRPGTTGTGGQTAIGGTNATDTLNLQGTAGNGTLTSPAIQMLVGNNGATNALTILNNGKVGIGTTTPGAPLDINVSGSNDILFGRNVGYPTYGAISMNGSLSDTGMIGFFGGGGAGGSDKSFYFQTPTGGSIVLRPNGVSAGVNGANVVTISGTQSVFMNGNVGIGTTAPVSQLSNTSSNILDAGGVGMAAGSLSWSMSGSTYGLGFQNTYVGNNGNGLLIKTADISTNSYIAKFESGGVNRFAFRADGNLSMTSPNGSGISLSNGVDSTLNIRPVGSGQMRLSTDVAGRWMSFADGAGATDVLAIKGGNVGIGTTSPVSKLEVVGITKISGNGSYLNIDRGQDASVTDINIASGSAHTSAFQINTDQPNALVNLDTRNSYALAFQMNDAEKMRILSNGNVGIGTTNPARTLDVHGTIGNDSYIVAGTELYTGGTAYNVWTSKIKARQAGDNINFYNNAGTQLATILDNGNVGIGTASPNYLLQVNGQPAANGYTAWTNYSDARLKDNVTDITYGEDALSKISKLRPVTFNYNELSGYDEATRSRRVSGFIAQELQQVFPEMVGTTTINGTQYFDTNLSDLPLYLVKAIQEMNLKLEDINNMEKENSWRDSITAWLANGSNKITRIFTGEICLTDAGEETECINRAELKQLKALLTTPTDTGTSSSSPTEEELAAQKLAEEKAAAEAQKQAEEKATIEKSKLDTAQALLDQAALDKAAEDQAALDKQKLLDEEATTEQVQADVQPPIVNQDSKVEQSIQTE